MIQMRVEGVRRNFMAMSAFLYSVSLLDETGQRLVIFSIERHEALPIVVALNNLAQPRPETIDLMVETLKSFNHTLEELHIESYSRLPPVYHLCECRLRWRTGETVQEQTSTMRSGVAIALALHMGARISVSDGLFRQIGITLVDDQTPEHVFITHLLQREGISLPEDKKLRLGYSKTPLRDALVKEFKAALLGKAPISQKKTWSSEKKTCWHLYWDRLKPQRVFSQSNGRPVRTAMIML